MEEKKLNKKFYILSIIIALLVVTITVGVSYAYFTANVAGNNSATTSVITSGNMALELVDGNVIGTTQSMIPGDSITKTFSVRNTGTLATTYDVYLSEVLNTFVDKSDLVYSLESSDGGYNTVSDQIVPSTSGDESKLISAYPINVGATHTYTLTIKFLNKDENQDDNKGASFSAKLQINEYSSFKISILNNNPFSSRAFGSYMMSLGEMPSIYYIKRISSFDETIPKITISTDDSTVPVYVWYKNEDKTLYYYSEASIIYLPEDSSDLFRDFDEVKTIDLSGFDTSNVTNMSGMFSGMSSLLSLDLSNFNTSNVTNMSSMFFGTSSLASLNISKFNTSNVENMSSMFMNNALSNINLSNFDTSKVRDMSWMFSGITNVETLDLSSFSSSSLLFMSGMFSGMSNLNQIYVSNLWSNQNLAYVATNVFNGCSNLVGELGTTFDENNTSSEYAHIDGGLTNPGYFTYKANNT